MDPEKSGRSRPPSGWRPNSSPTPAPGAGFGAGACVNAVYKQLIKGLYNVTYIHISWEHLGPYWAILGPSWAILGQPWSQLRP